MHEKGFSFERFIEFCEFKREARQIPICRHVISFVKIKEYGLRKSDEVGLAETRNMRGDSLLLNETSNC